MSSKKPQNAPVRIIEDNPATEKRHFGFDAYAETLAGMIANKNNVTPLVMGVYGESGAGKTTLMKAVGSRLDQGVGKGRSDYRRCKTVWFNAWKHEGKDEILAALVARVFKAMDADGFFSLAKTQMESLTKRIDKSKIFPSVSQLAAGADVSEFFSDMVYKEELGFYDTFQKFFNDLIWTFLNWRFKLTEEEKPDDKKAALVIFVDDLDHCTRPHIVKVLETITLFMARSGWVFVLGASKEKVQSALEDKFGGSAARDFMEKIIHVNFHLPEISTEDFTPLIDTGEDGNARLKDHLSFLIPALEYSPRRLKRFFSAINLVHGLLGSTGVQLTREKVLLWGLMDKAFPALAALIKGHPHNLDVLQKQIKKLNARKGDKPLWQLNEEQLREEKVPHALHSFILTPGLDVVVTALDLSLEQFESLQACCRIVGFDSPMSPMGASLPQTSLISEPMSTIAYGPFLMGADKNTVTIDDPFEMDIYPVTNGRFRTFVEAGGYTNSNWWSKNGWQWRRENAIDHPAFWDDSQWCREAQPIVGICWYEAEAYVNWASKSLPTEQQWERAARGTDGWEYPWGNEFDKNRCNTQVSESKSTTSVNCYSNGVSPEGCYDMSGNIWEWTATTIDGGEQTCFVKGGSWFDSADLARCSVRREVPVQQRSPFIGFRCVQQK